MPWSIRIILIVVAVLFSAFVLSSIRRSKMRIEDSLFWAFLVALILLLSLFPQIGTWFSEILGFQAPINFIFLFFIFVLLAKCFSMSRQISHQETKIKELTQQVAITRLEQYERTNGREGKFEK